uniref:Uncharacterized protein n=1 Tax=Timema douglasi TaxID=61478 RepID=A0A7R8VL18_TIMDO|nr:unnamed protein product [Timema douglasi]
MEGVKTCQELNHDGTICEESRTLKILEELQTLYAERLKRIDDEAGGDGVQLKITTMESWVRDLTIQNAILVHTVELLEHEASERVLLLQKRLQESSKSALEYMTKVQDYDSQMQEATGEKIRSQSQEIWSEFLATYPAPGFDPRHFLIFFEALNLDQGQLSLMRSYLNEKVAAPI